MKGNHNLGSSKDIIQAAHFTRRNEDDIGLNLQSQHNDFAQKYLFRGTNNDLKDDDVFSDNEDSCYSDD